MLKKLAAVCLLLPAGCAADLPFLWKTYEHPTYRFSLRVPRGWEMRSGGLFGAQVSFLASEKDPLFRANVNVVVQPRTEKKPLETLAQTSFQQLTLVMNEYQLLSKAFTKLGDLPAAELRGRYRATEGLRILRSVIAFTDDMEYIFTFSCREEREEVFQKTVAKMISSFRAPKSLR